MAPLSWRHHALIQALLSRGPLKEEEFYAVFTGVSGKNPVTYRSLLNDVLLKINKELAYLQFELRACRDQYDGEVYYGVVNNVADEQSKLGTKYSVPQIAFYKGVIEAIVQDAANEGCVTNIEALNIHLENQVLSGQGSQDSQSHIPPAFRNFSMTQKEKTLNDLIRDRLLSHTSSGKIGLGIRSFFDLRSWFRTNDIPSCDVCNEAGVKGSRACPGCSTEWPRSECEEEEDTTQPEESQLTSADTMRKRLRSAKSEAVEATQSQEPSAAIPRNSAAIPRKKHRSFKLEAVDVAKATDSVGSPQPTRPITRRSTRLT
ncbi:uncharacterized protein [Typha latifolia]|uniref:uncharacterized protein isoform X2 n=1 Tax=Typha latifolia TaxID=4733 RepID=UPI003C2EBBFB